MSQVPPIVLLTDFGLTDHYAGVLKGVILTICPQATVLDLTHGILPQNVKQAAGLLEISYSYYPAGSIFVSVVDPGVGTGRKILCVETNKYYFLAPDNGLLSFVLEREGKYKVRGVSNRRYFLRSMPSSTFHGRDIFSPVAAHMAKLGAKKIFRTLGPLLSSVHQLKRSKIKKTQRGIEGEITFFDHFGNAMTNIHRRDAEESFWRSAQIEVGDLKLGKIRATYGQGKSLVGVWNSADQFEIALPGGSARLAGTLEMGQLITLRHPERSEGSRDPSSLRSSG